MTTTNTTTTTYNPTPTRISSTHYQLPSRTREDKMHNLKLQRNKQGRLAWLCDCEDATYNKNPNCDHRIYLIEWIQQEKAKRQEPAEQKHSTSIELLSVLSRISSLEEEAQIFSKTLQAQNDLIDIKDQQIIILQDKLRAAEYQLKQQQERLDDQRELIAALQTSVCRLNERTINQDTQIQKLTQAHDELANFAQEIYLQAQQKAPAKARQTKAKTEQAPAAKPAKRGRKVSPNKVEAIKENGLFTKCIVGGEFEVKIDQYFAPQSCTCSKHQDEGVYCVHMQRVDSEFA